MDLLSLIIIIVVVGVLLWAINAFIPMQDNVKRVLNIVVVVVLVLWLLSLFSGYFPRIHVGR